MATMTFTNDEYDTRNNHLQTFRIIWLDCDISTNTHGEIDENLRHIIDDLKIFRNIGLCEQHIEQTSKETRLIVIVSDMEGKQMIPDIHHLPQVSSIYIYCTNKYKDQRQWTDHFSKVRGVFDQLDELVIRLKKDQDIRQKLEEPLAIHVFTVGDKEDKSTTGLNGKFVYSQLLLDCILSIKPNDNDQEELISWCRQEYQGNVTELANICDFEKNYSSDKVLWWYTRESFFYKTLNKALRTQDIHIIFLFRSYINDICHQLLQKQTNCSSTIYRCQLMSKDELNYLSTHIGQFISVNSFFSTSIQQHVASFYMGDGTPQNNLEKVLFEIHTTSHPNDKKPFANISSESEFCNEFEVLFTLGSIFRLNNIDYDDQIWTIRLTLCANEEHDLQPIVEQMKMQNGDGERTLGTLAKFVLKMGRFDLAEEYYSRCIRQLPSDDPSLLILYKDLDHIAAQTGDFDKSLQWQIKLMSLKQTISSMITIKNSKNSELSVIQCQSSLSVIRKRKTYPTGDVYDGETLNDLYHGCGVYTWKNGNQYEGMWRDNYREGQGAWIWGEQTPSAGDRYIGQWHLNKKHGHGQYFQANGDMYTGEFTDDQRHGTGIYQTQNGQCLHVVYNRDELISSEEIEKR